MLFETKIEFEEFRKTESYRELKRMGFKNDKGAYDECKRMGFKTKSEYEDFLASSAYEEMQSMGFGTDKIAYDECKNMNFESQERLGVFRNQTVASSVELSPIPVVLSVWRTPEAYVPNLLAPI